MSTLKAIEATTHEEYHEKGPVHRYIYQRITPCRLLLSTLETERCATPELTH